MRAWIARHETALFIALTFGIAWPLWLVSGALGRTPVRAPDLSWMVAQIGVFAPAFAGLALGAWLDPGGGRRGARTLACVYLPAIALGFWIATRGFASFAATDAPATVAMIVFGIWVLGWFAANRHRSPAWGGPPADRVQIARWSLISLGGPIALFLLAWGLVGGEGETASGLPALPVRDPTLFGLVSAFALNLSFGGSLGEEPGWRGAWLPRLLRRRSPLAASLVISFWWALWHAPIDIAQGFGAPGVGGLVVRQIGTLPVAILFTWVALRAGGSLLPPLILHTAVNAMPDFALSQPARYERATMLLFVFLAIAALVVALGDARMRERVASH